MNTVVLSLTDGRPSAVALRCEEYAGFVSRCHAVGGATSTAVRGAADPAAALTGLARAAVVAAAGQATGGDGPVGVVYVPTRVARERVGTEQDGSWPQSIAARQRKVIRRTPGATFRFPMERSVAGDADDEPIEVFITDWSPSPAACAIAVHPAHPRSIGSTPKRGVAFTGRYCRHPLTGDLLPIWVAPWVKPEFGSGAVLVNPGHDKVDLAFGREVGLPIRFALAPETFDGSPSTWLVPPVIKTGVAIRTGSTDGLAYDDARAEYFRILVDRGLAETCTDYGAGAFTVARITDEGPAKIGWDHERRTVASAGQEVGSPVRVTGSPVLAATDAAVRSAALVVVAPSTGIEADLLALRLLLSEPGLAPQVDKAPEVLLVGAVAGQVDAVADEVLRLTLLVAAGSLDTLSVKAPQVEASQRFLEAHAQVAARPVGAGGGTSAEVGKAAAQVKSLLQRRDTKQAFTQLYRLQKTVAKAPAPTEADLRAYDVLAHVLTGVSTRRGEHELREAWQHI